jgi:hypothetical protein
VAVLAAFVLLLIAGLWQLRPLQQKVFTVSFLSVGVTRADVEDICGEPDAWITDRAGLTREPWADFPASTRPIETAIAAYRQVDGVLYVYYDEDVVTCLFHSERGGATFPRDGIRPPRRESR